MEFVIFNVQLNMCLQLYTCKGVRYFGQWFYSNLNIRSSVYVFMFQYACLDHPHTGFPYTIHFLPDISSSTSFPLFRISHLTFVTLPPPFRAPSYLSSCHVLSCLCDNICRRFLAICRRIRTSCLISRLRSAPIQPACAAGERLYDSNKTKNL